MGLVYADIKLTNESDLLLVRRNIIDQDGVKQLDLRMLVATGAYMLSINENIQAILQLPFVQKRRAQNADRRVMEFDVAGPVRVEFKDRMSMCIAMILPGDSEPLLGAVPMEEMDVVVLPLEQKLAVNPGHPEYALMRI